MKSPSRVEIKTKGEMRILVIPDQHFPFVDKKHLKSVISAAKEHKPTHIVNVGDTYDMYSFSRFTRSLDLIKPKEEISAARSMAEGMWKGLRAASPKAECFQVLGNHEERVIKKLLDKNPEYESLLEDSIDGLIRFEGVQNLESSKSELVINDIVFVHGWSTTPGYHVRYFLQSVVHGHTHRGGVTYVAHKGKTLYELDCGFIADVNALPLQYGETKTSTWHPGYGYIDKYGPRFIPL